MKWVLKAFLITFFKVKKAFNKYVYQFIRFVYLLFSQQIFFQSVDYSIAVHGGQPTESQTQQLEVQPKVVQSEPQCHSLSVFQLYLHNSH